MLKKQWLDSAIVFWDDLKSPDIAAIFSGKKRSEHHLQKTGFMQVSVFISLFVL